MTVVVSTLKVTVDSIVPVRVVTLDGSEVVSTEDVELTTVADGASVGKCDVVSVEYYLKFLQRFVLLRTT